MTNCVKLHAILVLLINAPLMAQTSINSRMNWDTGELLISALWPLQSKMMPSNHPEALNTLEQELPPLAIKELKTITWNREKSMGEMANTDPGYQSILMQITGNMKRNWSRISEDYSSIQAEYSVNLFEAANQYFPAEYAAPELKAPISWFPQPEDPWSGIVIYLPDKLPLRGTGTRVKAIPALKARILSDSLDVLFDPEYEGYSSLRYYSLENHEQALSVAGRRPYRTMASALYGSLPCDIILSEMDTQSITASESGRQALYDGKIVILFESIEP